MNSILIHFRHFRRIIQTGIYLVVLVSLLVLLYRLGTEPWRHILDNFRVFFYVAFVNAIGIFIQAGSFREVQPLNSSRLSWRELIRIWSFSGVVSVVAPVIAGLATRTTLLVQAGMPLSICVTTSIRQIWVGLEYAFLLGGIAGLFVAVPGSNLLVLGMIMVGVFMVLFRLYGAKLPYYLKLSSCLQWLELLRAPVVSQAHPWFLAQIGAMSTIYFVAFNGFGASITWEEAILLSSVTVFASLIVLIPNGLGVIDTIWVIIAMQSGLGLEQSVALAITLRMAYLTAAVSVWVTILAVENIIYRTVE